MSRRIYVSDFETTTLADDCRVWGWGLCDIDDADSLDNVEIGQDMDSFVARISKKSSIIYFHNLKFDGRFIFDWLLNNGFTHSPKGTERGQFTNLISRMGEFYSITVHWRNGRKTEFRDSAKKLPMSARGVAEAFKLEVSKGEIDYHAPRPVGHVLTPEERNYLARDVIIIAQAIRVQIRAGMDKLTIGADSLSEFKDLMGRRMFNKLFPVLPESMDAEIRKAYRGGFTYADKRFTGKRTRSGKVYDVNSLYPSVMYNSVLPYGEPIFYDTLPEISQDYPLYIVSVTFTGKLKKDHIPIIQIKGSTRFNAVDYQRNITDPVTMTCTNVDLELWKEHYDLDILSYNGGWSFRGYQGAFDEYIDKWMEVKANSVGGMRAIAKLHLNSLYGKFATNPDITGKYPYLDDKGVVRLALGEEEVKDPVYTAMGVFITAYAREVTIRAAQQNYDVFAYADTDSLHLLTDEHPVGLDIDPHKLGTWKHEYDFTSAIYVRPKAYIEHVGRDHCQKHLKDEDHVHIPGCEYETHIAGLQEDVAVQLTFDDITNGRKFVKKTPQAVPGGIVLNDVGFTLKL